MLKRGWIRENARAARGYWFTGPISTLFNPRIATAARTSLVGAFIGIASVSIVAACDSAGDLVRSSTPAASPTTTVGASGKPPSTSSPIASPAGTDGIYGHPDAAAKYWRQQSEDNCGLASVADVVGEITGDEPTEKQMITFAQNTASGTNPGPIYAPSSDPCHNNGNGGVEMADLVVLLDHYGIKSLMAWTGGHPEKTGMPVLQQYLTDNRKVIAWVNSAIIWDTSDQRTKADHYLVVTGIDTNKEIVHLNDPGADHADERVSIANFVKAWKPVRNRWSSLAQPADQPGCQKAIGPPSSSSFS